MFYITHWVMLALWLKMVLSTAMATTKTRPHLGQRHANVFQLEDLCQSATTEIFIQDAVTITWKTEKYILDDHSENETDTRPNVTEKILVSRCQIIFNLPPEHGAFLFVTLQNHLPINRDRCMAWNPMLRLRSRKQGLPLGCVRSTSRFFDPPLTLIANTLILRSLLSHRESGSFVLTVSAVTFECNEHETELEAMESEESPVWWPCSLHERYCVQRQLFCDGVNNCGDNEDEDVNLCNPSDTASTAGFDSDNDSRRQGSGHVLRQILRHYKKTQDAFAFTLVAPENADGSEENWQNGYIPVAVGFFCFLALTCLVCFGYVWWTKHRNQRLKHNFIDYVMKYRRRAASTTGNRLGLATYDSYPFGLGEVNNFVTTSDETPGGFEWTAEHRSLLGRRR